MKQNIAKVFTFSLLASSISFISCVDNEKNLFDADQLKQIYEETFPVKNIDPDGDWTVSRSVTAHVSVNGDQGVDYKIQIFDADPLSPGSTAKLLAEGTVNQSTTLNVVMDCATALDKVFVARIDEHKRYLVQPAAIENGTVTAHFGDKGTPTRSMSRAVATNIPVMEAPYTTEFISDKKMTATEVKNGCYLKAGKLQFGTLVMGNTSEAICKELTGNGNDNNIVMEAQSMLTCTGKANLFRTVTGPTQGTALLRIHTIDNTAGLAQSTSKVTNNIICEITDQTYKGEAHYDWSPFAWLVNKGLQQGATYCNPGKAEFILPADGDCIKEGYNSDEEPDNVEIRYAVYSYAFEDNYPKAGDYDFNDIVLNVTLPAAGNDVKELKYKIDLRAVGAVKQLGAGLRIRGIDKNNVEEVNFGAGAAQRTGSLNSGIFENASYETNGNELVIPLFGDAHYIYGYTGTQRPMLNTGNASTPLTDIYTLEVNVKLKNAISVPSVTDDLDFFIAYQGIGQKRTEIHLTHFNSSTANGQLADNEVLEVIKAVNNTWALCVPDKFAYPTETTVITNAYSKFADWAHDQSSTTDWYKTVSSDKVIQY